MKTIKEIAFEIASGNEKMKNELEKMMGKEINKMTKDEKVLGLSCLAVALESGYFKE